MDSVPFWRTLKKIQDYIHTIQRKIIEGYPLSLPEGNDHDEKN